jgi:hypothetical protein
MRVSNVSTPEPSHLSLPFCDLSARSSEVRIFVLAFREDRSTYVCLEKRAVASPRWVFVSSSRAAWVIR